MIEDYDLDFDIRPHVDNIHVTCADMKHKLLSHLLEHLGYSVTCLQLDYDLRQQLKDDIRWEKYNHETCKSTFHIEVSVSVMLKLYIKILVGMLMVRFMKLLFKENT